MKQKLEICFYVVLVLFSFTWVLRSVSDFRPVRNYIEGKMGRFGITTNMTLEEACAAGLEGIDRAGRSQALNSHSTVEELLDKVIK